MDWSDLKGVVSKAAPLLGTLLGGPAGGAVGALVSQALGADDDSPEAVHRALQQDPQALVRIRELEMTHAAELRRMVIDAETQRLGEVNQTMRAEAASTDAYVRRWRPTFGYAVALTWVLQTAGIVAGVIYAITKPDQADNIIRAVSDLAGALALQWSVALAVLGINVSKRSQDKQVLAGQTPQAGLLGALAQRISGVSGG